MKETINKDKTYAITMSIIKSCNKKEIREIILLLIGMYFDK